MRDKILKAKCLHVELSNKASEIVCEVTVSPPEDYKNEKGISCTGVWDTGSEGCLISTYPLRIAKKKNLGWIINYIRFIY